MSLLRVQFDFDHRADDALRVDVKKSKVIFDPSLEEYLEKLLAAPRRAANQLYRGKQQQKASTGISHTASNINIAETQNTAKPDIVNEDKSTNTVTINNSRGTGLKIKAAVQTTAEDTSLYVKQEPLPSGDLWQPVYRQSEGTNATSAHKLAARFLYQGLPKRSQLWCCCGGHGLVVWALPQPSRTTQMKK